MHQEYSYFTVNQQNVKVYGLWKESLLIQVWWYKGGSNRESIYE